MIENVGGTDRGGVDGVRVEKESVMVKKVNVMVEEV